MRRRKIPIGKGEVVGTWLTIIGRLALWRQALHAAVRSGQALVKAAGPLRRSRWRALAAA